MQPIKERQIKPYQCKHCPKSFKSSNGLKYHLEKVHFDEENKMEEGKSFFSMEEMPAKPRTIPPALNLRAEEVTLLTEFALIATSPQSPLVREVSGENSYVKRREDDSPPPQLMDLQSTGNWRCVSKTTSENLSQTELLNTTPAAKRQYFMAGTKLSFPDEDGWTWRTVDDLDMDEISADMFQDGLRVMDYQRIEAKFDNNTTDEFIVTFKSCSNEETSFQAEITADHPFFVKGADTAGWASFDPAATESHYGISCQPLRRNVCVLPYDSEGVGLTLNGKQLDGKEKTSEFTAMDSTAALTLSSMAKDKEEHSHRRTKLFSGSHSPPSPVKRNNTHQFNKRPMNAFMLFAKRFRLEITQAHPGKDNRAISVILGDKWKAMKQEDRKEYVLQAKLLADEHKRVNPDCWKRKRTSEGSSKISYRRP
ncbi:HMG box-containing protein 1-like isoform X1 [Pocillopora verrucosa]|uniref:HMG box-containing protein 1-like isoform X1 n=2 Tax=Pocillopora verrucosa TaxID=203993 RepID=UPI00334116AE